MTARGTIKPIVRSCRTVEEGRRVQAETEKHGLRRGEDGLEVYVMCEMPRNVLLPEEFAEVFNGFSIASVITAARAKGRKVGMCYQTPSDYPRVRTVSRRARHRQHFAQSRHGAEDDGNNLGEGTRRRSSDMKLHAILLAVIALAIAPLPRASAHCDGLDGPVVQAALKAHETGEVNLVLTWVQNPDEGEIKRAFDHAQAVRKLSAEARELADQYFFETLVSIHRASEGASYTGLKPAGRDLGPAIPLADKALHEGNVDKVLKLLTAKSSKPLTSMKSDPYYHLFRILRSSNDTIATLERHTRK